MMEQNNQMEQMLQKELKKAGKKLAKKAIRSVLAVLSVPLTIIALCILVVVVLNNAPEYYGDKCGKWFSETFGTMDDSSLAEYGLSRDMITDEYVASMAYANDIDIMTHLFTYAQEDITFGTWQMDYTDLMRVMDAVREEDNSHLQERTARYSYYEIGPENAFGVPSITEYEEEITFSLADIELEGEQNGTYAYQLRWQEVAALCLMASVQNNDEWGYKYEEEPNENGFFSFLGSTPTDRYFLSDDVIDGIINTVNYDFSYHYNPIKDSVEHYAYDDMEKYAYYLVGDSLEFESEEESGEEESDDAEAAEEEDTHADAETGESEEDTQEEQDSWLTSLIGREGTYKKVPALAPSFIGNTYMTITYPLDSNNMINSRVVSYRPHMFVQTISQYIPDFRFDMYLDILRQFPMSDDLVAKYELLYEQYKTTKDDSEVEALYQTTSYEFPSKGVVIGSECRSLTAGDFEYIQDENVYAIWFVGVDESSRYGTDGNGAYIYISRSAMEDSLLVSDNLTVEQIQVLVDDMYANARATNSRFDCAAFLDTAEGLYRAQEEFGVSVLGILSIIKIEGTLHEYLGQYGYNYFNYGCYEGGVPFTSHGNSNGRFLDCKQTYGDDPSECIYQIIKKIYKFYFCAGQDTFYKMCFNNYVEGELGTIRHSWCPPCSGEDLSISPPGTPPESFRCWSNACASYRLSFYRKCIEYGFFSE